VEIAREQAVSVVDRSHVGKVRRAASDLARSIGLPEYDVGRVAIVVTEAATNLIKHAGGGEILLRATQHDEGRCMDVMALDRGPGIVNLNVALRDGFSTWGSLGSGLGAIVRQSDLHDIHSAAGIGTAIFARVSAGDGRKQIEVGGVSVAKSGQEVCGDGWAVACDADQVRVLVTDGLGHGPLAAEASTRAREVFLDRPRLDLVNMVDLMHAALGPTRGAALAVAEVDPGQDIVRFVGVGNIAAAVLVGGESRSMVSRPGTVGHNLRKVQEFQYPWPVGALLVMHSDGLVSRWSLDRYPALGRRAPSLIAAILYRDFHRGRDDTTVVVMRDPR